MPSGFKTFGEEDFDRVFMKETEIIDNFVGNKAWACGYNGYGQLGDGTTTARSSAVINVGGDTKWKQVSLLSDYSCGGVKTDGTLWTWGWNGYGMLGVTGIGSRSSPGTTDGGGTNWKQVSCGYNNGAAIKTDGTLWMWGGNTRGQIGNGTRSDFTNYNSPITTAGGGTNWKEVSIGGYGNVFGLKTDGTLWSWGRDSYGSLAAGTSNVSRVISLL
jgi:alpha-tubulin suppressor-like RCC1 family protein